MKVIKCAQKLWVLKSKFLVESISFQEIKIIKNLQKIWPNKQTRHQLVGNKLKIVF